LNEKEERRIVARLDVKADTIEEMLKAVKLQCRKLNKMDKAEIAHRRGEVAALLSKGIMTEEEIARL
jgi:hypothetical protein